MRGKMGENQWETWIRKGKITKKSRERKISVKNRRQIKENINRKQKIEKSSPLVMAVGLRLLSTLDKVSLSLGWKALFQQPNRRFQKYRRRLFLIIKNHLFFNILNVIY